MLRNVASSWFHGGSFSVPLDANNKHSNYIAGMDNYIGCTTQCKYITDFTRTAGI